MAISAQLVKDLRERTGAGMMECKKALVEAEGDIEAAVEVMRKRGLAKADKKAGRVAAEGAIIIAQSDDARRGAIVEINCETDFVAAGDDFKGFANEVAQRVLEDAPEDLDALMALKLASGDDVETAQKALIAKIGENVQVRRFARYETSGVLASYLHGSRIGVMVELEGGDEDLARDLCMHIAASNPVHVTPDEVDEALVAKERDILVEQAKDSGKPAEIVEKMVEGRLRKWLGEITLVGQPFVKDPDQTVGKLLESRGARVAHFTRFEVGEGKEKKQENFAEEVAAQVKGS
ncbi:Elongation factor Ts [wastewater metagenome]|uniref:Elongation factor Ts n=2 Tax=unclassified sequences TaxID=12908 RepID=A0A5B8R7H8_9ZZZZ|nr:translation elongation factor Ts [Arhodomonas sp. KWT]QEA04646.1 elongation factor Ts [uncultured organism]